MKRYPHLVTALLYDPVAITRQKHAAICRVFDSILAGTAAAMPMDDEEPDDEEQMPDFCQIGDTAVIPVCGIIGKHLDWLTMASGGCDLAQVSDTIRLAVAEKSVRRILFNFRTPGGSVVGLPEAARLIAEAGATKETIGYTDTECCSAGYWLASQCRAFYCSESAQVGSIGVWSAYLDASRAYANEGFAVQEFKAGKYKTLGAEWRPLSDEEKAMIQSRVDKIYAQFKAAVRVRGEIADADMQGQVFDGTEALEKGLADGLVDDINDLIPD